MVARGDDLRMAMPRRVAIVGRMRWSLAVLVGLAGCVNFHPLQRAAAPQTADATAVRWRANWQTIGQSVEGRPLRIARVGRGARRVLWIGGIHGDEREGRIATEELPYAFLDVPGADALVTLTILEDANPDGSHHGTRGNRNGIDLNRNHPARNFLPSAQFGQEPLDQPESRALHELILREQPHLVIVAHAWRGDHFVNFDGPGLEAAQEFSRRSGYRVKDSRHIPPTPGSLGSWVGNSLGIPILTLEYERGSDPHADWLDTRAAILAVILGS